MVREDDRRDPSGGQLLRNVDQGGRLAHSGKTNHHHVRIATDRHRPIDRQLRQRLAETDVDRIGRRFYDGNPCIGGMFCAVAPHLDADWRLTRLA